MWATIEESNIYATNIHDGDEWYSEPTSINFVASNVYSSIGSILYGSNFDSLLNINSKLLFNTLPFSVKEIVSANQLKVNESLPVIYPIGLDLYTISDDDFSKQIAYNKAKTKILNQCENILTSSGMFNFPTAIEKDMLYGLFEFAIYKLSGGTNDAQEDINNGIVKKKIDVLEWEYDRSSVNVFSKYGIPNRAMVYLNKYVNPNFQDGLNAITSTNATFKLF